MMFITTIANYIWCMNVQLYRYMCTNCVHVRGIFSQITVYLQNSHTFLLQTFPTIRHLKPLLITHFIIKFNYLNNIHCTEIHKCRSKSIICVSHCVGEILQNWAFCIKSKKCYGSCCWLLSLWANTYPTQDKTRKLSLRWQIVDSTYQDWAH